MPWFTTSKASTQRIRGSLSRRDSACGYSATQTSTPNIMLHSVVRMVSLVQGHLFAGHLPPPHRADK
eukprot:6461713-Amphidinium_carterae.1